MSLDNMELIYPLKEVVYPNLKRVFSTLPNSKVLEPVFRKVQQMPQMEVSVSYQEAGVPEWPILGFVIRPVGVGAEAGQMQYQITLWDTTRSPSLDIKDWVSKADALKFLIAKETARVWDMGVRRMFRNSDDTALQNRAIRLAYLNPSLRPKLLAILKKADWLDDLLDDEPSQEALDLMDRNRVLNSIIQGMRLARSNCHDVSRSSTSWRKSWKPTRVVTNQAEPVSYVYKWKVPESKPSDIAAVFFTHALTVGDPSAQNKIEQYGGTRFYDMGYVTVDGKRQIVKRGPWFDTGKMFSSILPDMIKGLEEEVLLELEINAKQINKFEDDFAASKKTATAKRAGLGIGDTYESEAKMLRIHRFRDALRITDLTNAGKRGKKVRQTSVSDLELIRDPAVKEEWDRMITHLPEAPHYDAVCNIIRGHVVSLEMFGKSYVPEMKEIEHRGIDVTPATFTPLKIETDDIRLESEYDSFSIRDKRDKNNDPTCIPKTKGGKAAIFAFYRWVRENESEIRYMKYRQVLEGMEKAGIPFHEYCGMD